MLGGMIVIQTGWRKKEAGRRFPYFRPAGVYAPALRTPPRGTRALLLSSPGHPPPVSLAAFHKPARPALSFLGGKFVIEEK